MAAILSSPESLKRYLAKVTSGLRAALAITRIRGLSLLSDAFLTQDRREPPVHVGFTARSKLNRAQTGARLRVALGTYVPVVAIRATEIPPIQPLGRGFPEVSTR